MRPDLPVCLYFCEIQNCYRSHRTLQGTGRARHVTHMRYSKKCEHRDLKYSKEKITREARDSLYGSVKSDGTERS
jgi:hypothetical protein